jgi:hypothetical protein
MFSNPGSSHPLHTDSNCLTEDELGIIIEYEEESARLGNFERIFPLAQNAAHYAKFFEYERPSNELLAKYLKILPQHVNPQMGGTISEPEQISPGVKTNLSESPERKVSKQR